MFCNRVKTIAILILAAGLFSGAVGPAWASPEEESYFAPPAVYQIKGRRDPFVQPQAGMLHNVVSRMDIEVLRLTGVISHPRRSLALFTTQTGPKFGYLLKDGKLYGENHKLIGGVTGEIVSRERVILKQGDKRLVFQLR